MGDVCVSKKCNSIRSLVVGPVTPALFEKSNRGIESGTKAIGRRAQSRPVFAGDSEEMGDKQSGDGASNSKQPQVNGRENETDNIHSGFKAPLIEMMVGAFMSFFSVLNNTFRTLQKRS